MFSWLGAGQRTREEAPVDEVARVMNLDAGEPLEVEVAT